MTIAILRLLALPVIVLALTASAAEACRRSPDPAAMIGRPWRSVAVVRIVEVEADDRDPALGWVARAERVGQVEGEAGPGYVTLRHRELPNCRERRAVPRPGEYWVAYLATLDGESAWTAHAWPLEQARAIDPRFSAAPSR